MNPAAEDFHLTPGSPAVAGGRCLPELTTDRDGVCYADPPTVGGHEGG